MAYSIHGCSLKSLDVQQSNDRQQDCQNETYEQDATEMFVFWVTYPVRENDGMDERVVLKSLGDVGEHRISHNLIIRAESVSQTF